MKRCVNDNDDNNKNNNNDNKEKLSVNYLGRLVGRGFGEGEKGIRAKSERGRSSENGSIRRHINLSCPRTSGPRVLFLDSLCLFERGLNPWVRGDDFSLALAASIPASRSATQY